MSKAVEQMFARIAKSYDAMNTLITLGLHRRWRRLAVRLSGARPGMRVLDCACGTGDFALEFLRAVGPSGQVVAIDICEPMLAVFRQKLSVVPPNLRIMVADMLALPFEDGAFDIVSVGYGVRNVDDPRRALVEMARVAVPGGCVVVLETGVPSIPLWRQLALFYMRRIVPLLGSIAARNRDAYEYLPHSAERFPYGEAFLTMMRETGLFARCTAVPLAGGVSYIYLGITRS